jgi:hypothetical protein
MVPDWLHHRRYPAAGAQTGRPPGREARLGDAETIGGDNRKAVGQRRVSGPFGVDPQRAQERARVDVIEQGDRDQDN